jgi:hypothetical protein
MQRLKYEYRNGFALGTITVFANQFQFVSKKCQNRKNMEI